MTIPHIFEDLPLPLILPPKTANKHGIRLSGERPVLSLNTGNLQTLPSPDLSLSYNFGIPLSPAALGRHGVA